MSGPHGDTCLGMFVLCIHMFIPSAPARRLFTSKQHPVSLCLVVRSHCLAHMTLSQNLASCFQSKARTRWSVIPVIENTYLVLRHHHLLNSLPLPATNLTKLANTPFALCISLTEKSRHTSQGCHRYYTEGPHARTLLPVGLTTCPGRSSSVSMNPCIERLQCTKSHWHLMMMMR